MPKVNEKKYRAQKYRREWEKESWASDWLSISKRVAGKAYCSLCDKDLVAGKSELIGHAKSFGHIRQSKTSKDSCYMRAFLTTTNVSTIKAELNTVALIARKNIPFNVLDQLTATLHHIADDSKSVKDMTCNRTKGTYLLTECLSVYAHENLVGNIKAAKGISILCDKATDVSMKKMFCVNVRFLPSDSSEPVTKLYRLLPVEDGKVDGLFESLRAALEEDGISWDRVVGYASDGENLMQGQNNSFLTRMKEMVPDLFVLKCFCHSFHLVAEHACAALSKTADQLVHDVYNYFKNAPNRQMSYEDFQAFVQCEPHKILKPCQTRWLSVAQCVNRILQQWTALELFFVSEAAETKSPTTERILNALRSPYVKATLEFTDYVLGDLTGLNKLFQSDRFKLHRLLPEVERVVRMFSQNFMAKPNRSIEFANINVDDESKWLSLDKVYPGIAATETLAEMRPHERESFLSRCRNWYKEAIRQMQKRIDLPRPILEAFVDVDHMAVVKGKAEVKSAGVLASKLPKRLSQCCGVQTIDRQWRSLLVDDDVKNGGWEARTTHEFWQAMADVEAYKELATFMLEITALPQSTAVVERTFSKLNNNKTKLRNALGVRTMEAIVKVSEEFPCNFESNKRLAELHSKARVNYMKKYTDQERKTVEDNF